jgi:hypothetical protein
MIARSPLFTLQSILDRVLARYAPRRRLGWQMADAAKQNSGNVTNFTRAPNEPALDRTHEKPRTRCAIKAKQ